MALYIWYGKPRQCKSYVVTGKVNHWLDDLNLTVWTNFPVLTQKGRSPCIWKDDYIYQNIQDSQIVIDESYQSWGSQDSSAMKDSDRMTFIHTTGHQGNDIHFIAQSPVRILKAIRDIATEVYFVKKYCLPWPLPWFKDREGENRPIVVQVLAYSQWEDMMDPAISSADYAKFELFKMSIAKTYDTHFYRNNRPPFVGKTWLEQKIEDDKKIDPYNIESLFESEI